MPLKNIRLAELASTSKKPGLLPVSPSTIWRWTREGKFPKPIKLGERTTVWDVQAVEAFVAERAGNPGMKPQKEAAGTLVGRIHAVRKNVGGA